MRKVRLITRLRLPVALALFMACLTCSKAVVAQHLSAALTRDSAFTFRMYSPQVGDSFSLFIHLPAGYNAAMATKYPVVYLTDANFYFDMLAPIVGKYAEVGMLPPLVLVGIGYRDFAEMDSLLDRDFTFPNTTVSPGFTISGGGEAFLAFLQMTVMPDVERALHIDTTKRVLAGHSLGGYFTTYALMRHLSSGQVPFSYYIAASPAIDYNGYWLLNKLKQLPAHSLYKTKPGFYVTYGGLEDAEDADMPDHIKWETIAGKLDTLVGPAGVRFKTEMFSKLRHLDTAIPSFIKGLQQALYPD